MEKPKQATIEELRGKPRNDLTEYELSRVEEDDFVNGPLSLVSNAVNTGSTLLISTRNDRKLLGRVRAFDRHLNLILENTKEMWTHTEINARGQKKPVNMDRFIAKMFLRGDNIIMIVQG